MAIAAQWLITIVVNGQDLGTWDKWTGGEVQTKSTKYRPGGMVDEKVLRGLRTFSDGTATREYDQPRDHELCRTLQTGTGIWEATITKQPLDANGSAWGNPMVYKGQLSDVKPGAVDSASEAADTLELMFAITSVA